MAAAELSRRSNSIFYLCRSFLTFPSELITRVVVQRLMILEIGAVLSDVIALQVVMSVNLRQLGL